MTDSVLWESFKAVVRGDIISFQIRKKKEEKRRLVEIERLITEFETDYKLKLDPITLKKIISLKTEYNSILSKKTVTILNQVKQKHFELTDKPHKLLARQLRNLQVTRAIHKIQSKEGSILTDAKALNNRFVEFYNEVYKSKGEINAAELDRFLTNADPPKLGEEARNLLEGDIKLEEINEVITQLLNNKCAGPDGFSAEFCKAFRETLSPILFRMINHSALQAELPPTLYKANIALIPKPGRNKLEASSYRPVSLIPIETKIVSKVLANRLKKHICSIIHKDQTGFMPNRHIQSNLRRLFNIIYNKQDTEACLISLDAQRAFDQIEWSYMFSTLEKFGFGGNFLNWVKILYAKPEASVITNQILLGYIAEQGRDVPCPPTYLQ